MGLSVSASSGLSLGGQLAAAHGRFGVAAQRVVDAGSRADAAPDDLAAAVVDLTLARTGVEALGAVARAQSRTTGLLLDLLA